MGRVLLGQIKQGCQNPYLTPRNLQRIHKVLQTRRCMIHNTCAMWFGRARSQCYCCLYTNNHCLPQAKRYYSAMQWHVQMNIAMSPIHLEYTTFMQGVDVVDQLKGGVFMPSQVAQVVAPVILLCFGHLHSEHAWLIHKDIMSRWGIPQPLH